MTSLWFCCPYWLFLNTKGLCIWQNWVSCICIIISLLFAPQILLLFPCTSCTSSLLRSRLNVLWTVTQLSIRFSWKFNVMTRIGSVKQNSRDETLPEMLSPICFLSVNRIILCLGWIQQKNKTVSLYHVSKCKLSLTFCYVVSMVTKYKSEIRNSQYLENSSSYTHSIIFQIQML